MAKYKKEILFENHLKEYLTHVGGTKQWKKLDIKTTDGLWNNFRKIVYQLNQDKLDQPLSNDEFNQVKKQLLVQTKTPYDAGVFLYGVGGKSQIDIDRDDGKHVFLTIFVQDQIGAGNTVYQVVNQIQRQHVLTGKHDRRFDTTLLINGLPIIQIEEKADGHSAKEALNQMHQYEYEDQYSGIFSTVQILVAMTPHDVRYMANTNSDDFNTDFAFQWKLNGHKNPIMDWREFTDHFLSIPMAHKMATNFMILDNTPNHQSIKVMRYYQVYATEKIINKLEYHDFSDTTDSNKKVGYIWHTTGSGKTISSFKTAFLASRLPNVDKVVFLVDRVALTDQTFDEYRAYDPNTSDNNKGGIVDSTNNTYDLKRKLRSKKKNDIIVTSTQKMYRLIYHNRFSMDQKNIVFIVDEAHRSTSGDMLAHIKNAFKHSAWVGYTGTPNFNPDKGLTTEDVFGPCLHQYVISDAIADHNVLGFKVDFQTTIPDKEDKLSHDDMDDNIKSSVYDMNPAHVKSVVHDVLKYWDNRSVNGKYNALFTTHVGGGKASTPMAMMYYNEFKQQMKDMDRPLQIAVTFSQNTTNNDAQLETNKAISDEILPDYNKRFHTHFDDTQISEYFSDVVSRLNRTASDGRYLDLVIVINQLLTGFDAPYLNTLYVDRTLQGANLIQAYSRTNRIQNMQYKPYGHIVNYRWPSYSEKLMKHALAIYSNPASAKIHAKAKKISNNVLAKPFNEVKNHMKLVVGDLSELTDNFKGEPKSEAKQEQAFKELNTYNHLMSQMKQYDEFKDRGTNKVMHEIGLNEDNEARLTGPIADHLKSDVAKQHHVEPIDLNLKMEHVKEVTVNYDYLHQLIAEYFNHVHDKDLQAKELSHLKDIIYKYLESMETKDYKYADQIKKLLNDDLTNEIKYPLKPNQVDHLIKHHIQSWKMNQIKSFIHQWGVQNSQDKNDLSKLIEQHQLGNDKDLGSSNKLEDIVKHGQIDHQNASDSDVKKLSPIKYHNRFIDALKHLADKIKKHI
ncbi:DEAD/DEAH box helicase [Philodulcilactobacillus myokoensis]|uniref:Type I restriction enzyme endonuclease subunit n=1 Tax=Philodulcilactobacillus myokoensis TaxID=2929573 RepID=A0A9W6AYZ1_9LACO|nr:HsdR family type I site-specific deoxyribonuclease [Philodulcilactobacillus myokoensis]GLB46202.1 DEAD/DEAH box helicase [Philodulcilactobacillus myokoensis]